MWNWRMLFYIFFYVYFYLRDLFFSWCALCASLIYMLNRVGKESNGIISTDNRNRWSKIQKSSIQRRRCHRKLLNFFSASFTGTTFLPLLFWISTMWDAFELLIGPIRYLKQNYNNTKYEFSFSLTFTIDLPSFSSSSFWHIVRSFLSYHLNVSHSIAFQFYFLVRVRMCVFFSFILSISVSASFSLFARHYHL